MAIKLVGADDVVPDGNYSDNYFHCGKFTAEATGSMTEFRVKSAVAGNVKCAIYTDDAGQPGALITAMNTGQAVTGSGWEILTFTATDIVSGTVYWLAVIIDTDGAVTYKAADTDGRYRSLAYAPFTFPDPADGMSSTSSRCLMAGWGTVPVVGRSFGFIIG